MSGAIGIPHSDKSAVIEALKDGVSHEDILQKFKITERTLWRYRREIGLTKTTMKVSVIPDDYERLKKESFALHLSIDELLHLHLNWLWGQYDNSKRR